MIHKFLGIALLAATTAFATAGEVTGSVTYRDRSALPHDAIVIVRLEDTSVGDMPAKSIAELRFITAGKQVPIDFRLSFENDAIELNHRYVVRGEIRVGTRLLYTGSLPFGRHADRQPDFTIQLERVAPTRSIYGVTWYLQWLNGREADRGGRGYPSIKLDTFKNRLNGYTGVNSFSGMYKVSSSMIELQPGAQTLMAAAENLMRQEAAFRKAISSARSYRIVNGKLELMRNGKVLARFSTDS